jgi:hypothetical protein
MDSVLWYGRENVLLMIKNAKHFFVSGLLLSIAVGYAPAGYGANRFLDEIRVSHEAGQSVIRIELIRPMRYVTHSPQQTGDFLVIKLRPVEGAASRREEGLGERETSPWRPTDRVPLESVTFENDPGGGPTLTARFSRHVGFNVKGSADLRSIFISLAHAHEGQGKGSAAETQPMRPSLAASTARGKVGTASRAVPEVTPGKTADIDLSHPYAIHLMSTEKPIADVVISDVELLAKYRLYTSRAVVRGKLWHRLRLGFFPTMAAAQKVLPRLQADFPGAWITQVSEEERMASADTRISGPGKPAVERRPEPAPAPSAVEEARVAQMMEKARQATTEGNYSRAIQIYTQVLDLPENIHSQDALEFLGLAYERERNWDKARAIYERFLERYPEGPAADRVRQRIAGLVTAREVPPERRRPPRRAEEVGPETGLSGAFSQFYRRRERITGEPDDVTESDLTSDLDLTGFYRTDAFELSSRFSGGYTFNFIDRGDDDTTRVSTFYVEALDRQRDHFLKIGRQRRNVGGILGRFDGGVLGVRLDESVRLNFNGGFVTTSSTSDLDTDRFLFGINSDLGPFADAWDLNLFAIEQRNEGIFDRRAVGGQVRYTEKTVSVFGLLDYDVLFNDLNIILAHGTWRASDSTTYHMTLDYRKSLVLTAGNALLADSDTVRRTCNGPVPAGLFVIDSIGQLRGFCSESEIRDLAEKVTATSKSINVGVNHRLNQQFHITGDFQAFGQSSTAISDAFGPDFFYSIQLFGTSLLIPGDTASVGIRFADTDRFNAISMTLNARYPLSPKFRINPIVRVEYQDGDDGSNQWTLLSELRILYRLSRVFDLVVNVGAEYVNPRGREMFAEESVDYFVEVGYEAHF